MKAVGYRFAFMRVPVAALGCGGGAACGNSSKVRMLIFIGHLE